MGQRPGEAFTAARAACNDPANELLFSVASPWEMQIKIQLGKLKPDRPLREIIADQQRANRMQILSVAMDHVFALEQTT